MKTPLILTVVLAAWAGGGSAAWGASASANYTLAPDVFGTGGNNSGSAFYSQSCTIGERIIGQSTGGNVVLRAGFQAAAASDAPAPDVTITGNVTLGEADTTYENLDVHIAAGATITVAGQHHFKSLRVAGAITHAQGDATGVQLVVDGAVVIEPNGSIDVSGRGLRGGRQSGQGSVGEWWNNGNPTNSSYAAATYGETITSANPVYGNPLAPAELGSGGYAQDFYADAIPQGGNGGGRLYLVARSLQLNGGIYADGNNGYNYASGGSGGAIWIALNGGEFSGTGIIRCAGGAAGGFHNGGSGRIAIAGYSASTFTGTIGRAGSLFLQPAGRGGELRLDHTSLTIANGETLVVDAITTGTNGAVTLQNDGLLEMATDQLIVPAYLTLIQNGQVKGSGRATNVLGSLTVRSNAVITHTSGLMRGVELRVEGPVVIELGGFIDVSGRGLRGGREGGLDYNGEWWNNGSPAVNSIGATYGETLAYAQPAYGDPQAPGELGSGGGAWEGFSDIKPHGGSGGGRLFLVARSLQLDGGIYADGTSSYGGSAFGGSGGAIWILLDNGALSGAGMIRAAGGAGYSVGMNGGGGRIAISGHSASTFSGPVGPSGSLYTSTTPRDIDADGLPDVVEFLLGLDPQLASDGLLDADGDGHTIAQEYVAGTDPNNANDVLKVSSAALTGADGSIRLQFPTIVSRRYLIEWRASLTSGSWEQLGGERLGTGATMEVTRTTTDDRQKFYRISVQR